MPPGRILFNHMAPMAETPHTQNRNGSKVSRKVAYVQNDYHYTSSVTNMLRELKWSTHEQRRNQASLTMLHKIHKTPVTPELRPYSVPTAFKKIAERRGARCANASNAVQTLWKRCAIA